MTNIIDFSLYAPATPDMHRRVTDYARSLVNLMVIVPAATDDLLPALDVCLRFNLAYQEGRATVNNYGDVWSVVSETGVIAA